MSRSRPEDVRPRSTIPKCTLKGNSKNLHLATRDPKPPKEEVSIPPQQVPPQGETLAAEYVANLEQQLFLLNSEIRFAKDRAGVDVEEDSLSVDAAIRRLRMTCATHEEETNKQIHELQTKINDINEKAHDVNQERALEILEQADENERDEMESLERAFVEIASEINLQKIEKDHFETARNFHQGQQDSVQHGLEELQQHQAQQNEDINQLNNQIFNNKEAQHELLRNIITSIREKRLQEEKADFIAINSDKPKTPPPNIPIAVINAKNAKLEQELKNLLEDRTEMEHQVDLLLEKNVQIKAEYNEQKAKLEEARRIKSETDRMFVAKYNATKKIHDEQIAELSSIKQTKKSMKTKINELMENYSHEIAKLNDIQNQQELIQEVITFKADEKRKIDNENDQYKVELNNIIEEINEHRKRLDDLAHDIAKANEEKRRVQVIRQINEKDPKCSMHDAPPELGQLLQSLNTVKKAFGDL